MTREEAEVVLKCNSKQAEEKLDALISQSRELKKKWQEAFEKGDTKALHKTAGELQKVDKQIESMRTNAANVRAAMKRLNEATPRELQRTIRMINQELNSGRVKRGSEQWRQYTEMARRAKEELRQMNREMSGMKGNGFFSFLKSGWLGVTAAIGSVMIAWSKVRGMVEDYEKKEDAAAFLKSLTGLDDSSVNWLKEQATSLSTTMDESGLRITQSSEEILNAYAMVGSAKPELLGNKEALNLVTVEALRLSKAAKMELEPAVQAMTTALNQYGAGAEKAADYVNILAAGSKMGAAGVQEQAAAILKSGVAAASADVPMEQLVGCIEMLGEKGIKSEVAGTGLKKFFLTLQTGAKETNPKIVGLQQSLAQLRATVEEQEKLGAGKGAAYLKKMFGEEGYTIAAVLTSNVEKVKEYTDAVTDTQIAQEQAAINSDTMSNKMAQARNTMREAGIELIQALNPAILKFIEYTTMGIGQLSSFVRFLLQHKKAVALVVTALISYKAISKAVWLQEKLTAAVLALNNSYLAVKRTLLLSCTAAMNLLKAGALALTGNLAGARSAMAAFNAACNANPLGVVITAVTAAIAAMIAFSDALDDATDSSAASKQAIDAEADAVEQATKTREDARAEIEKDIKKLEEFNGSREDEIQLCRELNDKYGPVLGRYKSVASWLDILKNNSDDYLNSVYDVMVAEMKLEGARQMIAKAARLRIEAEDPDLMPEDWFSKTMDTLSKLSVSGIVIRKITHGKERLHSYAKSNKLEEADAIEKKAIEDMKLYEQELRAGRQRREQLQKELAKKYGDTALGEGEDLSSGTASGAAPETPKKRRAGRTTAKKDSKTSAQKAAEQEIRDKKAKDLLDSEQAKRVRASFEKEKAENLDRYEQNLIDYDTYLRKREDLTILSLEAEMNLLEKAGLKESESYKDKQREVEKREKEMSDSIRKYKESQINREKDAVINRAKSDYNDPLSVSFMDESELNRKTFEAESHALERRKALYAAGSEEIFQLQAEHEALMQEYEMKKQEELAARALEIASIYSDKEAEIKLKINERLTQELYNQGIISEEEYLLALRKLKEDYAEDSKQHESAVTATDLQARADRLRQIKTQYDLDLQAEKVRLEKGLISREEYARRVKALMTGCANALQEELGTSENEFSSMLNNLYDSFDKLFNDFNWETMFADMASAASAAFQVMSYAISSMSSYNSAAQEVELAKIDKRYEAEEKAAGNNQKKLKKIEERKQKEIAAVKKKYNERAMKMEIAQAVAQTAVAAINAYASASKVNWLLGPVAAAMAVAAGAIQIATIKKQHEAEAMGYYSGGFTAESRNNRDTVGVVHANEFVANHKAVANPAISPVLRLIDFAQKNNTVGSLTRADVSRAIGTNYSVRPSGGGDRIYDSMVSDRIEVLSAAASMQTDVIRKLNKQLDRGIEAYVILDGEQGLKRSLEKYDNLTKSPQRR